MASIKELEALRSRIVQILLSPHCQKIDFTYDNVHIDAMSYKFIAAVGELGRFKVQVDAAQSSEAMYVPKTNTFIFKSAAYGSNKIKPFEIMTIVHESTHCLIDAKGKKTSMLANEVCCYIAGALFNQFRKDDGLPAFDGTTQPKGDIYFEAHQLADRMATRVRKNPNMGSYIVLGSDNLVAALVLAVKASSTRYDTDNSYGEDGI